MGTFKIHSFKFETFKAKIEKMNKKARKLGLPEISFTEVSRTHYKAVTAPDYVFDREGEVSQIICFPAHDIIEIELTGDAPIIAGWKFVGVLEQNPDFANPIIHTVPGQKVPEKYWTDKSGYCDHCNTKRVRKETFIVENVETGEFKQVGRSCVALFLPNITPEQVAKMCSFYCQIISLNDEGYGDFDFSNSVNWDYAEFDVVDVIALAKAIARKDGWVSRKMAEIDGLGATADTVIKFITGNVDCRGFETKEDFRQYLADRTPTAEDEEYAKEIVKWILEEAKTNTEFMHNMKTICSLGKTNFRNIAGVSALTAVYAKHLSEQEDKKITDEKKALSNEYVGQIKGRLRDLHLRIVRTQDIPGYYGTTTIVTMEDEEGHSFVWFASRGANFRINDRVLVTGTVKEHKEFRGRKQTVLTRCEVERDLHLKLLVNNK